MREDCGFEQGGGSRGGEKGSDSRHILKRKRGAKGDFKVWGLHNQRDRVKQLTTVTKNA